MPPRSKVEALPAELKSELDRKLFEGAFSDYEGLAGWLAEQGVALSKSSLHRYGQRFEERMGALRIATEQARALVEGARDDEGVMAEALMRMAQEKIYSLLMEVDVDPDQVDINKLFRTIAEISRATVPMKRWQAEQRRAIAAEMARRAVEAMEDGAREAGLSDEDAALIRAKLLGVRLDE